MKDAFLPISRPDKYRWMIHAEKNALYNCVIRPDNGIAYVTGQCCNDCVMALWQEGIKTVCMANSHGTHLFDENEQKIFDTFIDHTNMFVKKVDSDLSWLGVF